MRIYLIVIYMIFANAYILSQNFKEQYDQFKKEAQNSYASFRNECNQKYIEFLRDSWKWYEGKSPLPMPKEDSPIPPRPYMGNEDLVPIETQPIEVEPIDASPQPLPIEPIKEKPNPNDEHFSFDFYGQKCKIRLPRYANLRLNDCDPTSIAEGWERLCDEETNNTIRDCLETRIRYNLCDWAYLMFLDKLGKEYCTDPNSATLLTAFLYCQSGYQMRLASDDNKLVLLYGSKHQIYDKGYFDIDGTHFYALGEPSNSISISAAAFEGETPMSLVIDKEQLLGADMSAERTIKSDSYKNLYIDSQVPKNLIEFYNSYPTSALDGNPMTRWAMYANTPLAKATKDRIYPQLKNAIRDLTKEEAAGRLLNWVQTGFVYEYDDTVWGYDRAFFAEESLYYPYCDCEDRSILFSRLIRDLLGLDVALIYYPGHLATAVCFDEDVKGDAMIINGRKFIVCDPTYIGAPVGAQMPDLEYDKARAIIL